MIPTQNSSMWCGLSSAYLLCFVVIVGCTFWTNLFASECEAERRREDAASADKTIICSENPSDDFTLVTTMFDLKRERWPHFRREVDAYLNNSIPLLDLDVNLLVFTEEKFKPFIDERRRGKENKTYVNVMHFTDLEMFGEYDRIKYIMQSEPFKRGHELLTHPEGFSPEYNILVNSKFYLLKKATDMNKFNTSFYFWIDFAYGHGHETFPKCKWAPMNLMADHEDKVTFIMLRWLYDISSLMDIHKKDMEAKIGGGFFGGSVKAIRNLYETFKEVLQICLNAYVIDDEQTIVIGCIQLNPTLFRLVSGSWYDAFRLFH